MTPILVTPEVRYAQSFADAVCEFQPERRYLEVDLDAVPAYIDRIVAQQFEESAQRVPESVYWLVDPDTDHFLGRLSIRHRLNPRLEQLGGNIGYEIRPSARGRGYGRLILQLGLEQARAVGLTRALLTCDATNLLSQRVIRANGGVLQDQITVLERPNPVMRWWITL